MIVAILTVAGAVAAMSLRNLVHSVLALTLAFAGLAAVYLQLGAQFIGFAQVLVYVGAVAILIVFAILLTRDTSATITVISGSWISGGIVALAIFGILAWTVDHSAASQGSTSLHPAASMQQIGNALMLQFALPLEIIGVLLTVALIGAVTLAMQENKETK
ncbi:MAG TPA: NADH-quinone oxidoreductase subunit J [Edaphobacter sp.]|nr:NADH-quinone oxidoreductase subunit J [Edaphobacter sp.]